MFDTICTLPLTSDLFALSIHPKTSVIAVGLASGHVQSYTLPPIEDASGGSNSSTSSKSSTSSSSSSQSSNSSIKSAGSSSLRPSSGGCSTIDTSWRTKRHKGSCRSLAYSTDGEILFSAGTDGIVKAARAETGRVESKIAVPQIDGQPDTPSLIHALSPQTLLLATDSSALHFYDLRSITARPQATHHPHSDYISSLTPLPPSDASTSGYSKQFVTTGGTTLAVTDLRRGVLVKSDDQEEELLSSCIVSGVGKKGRGERVLVGTGSGVMTVWEKGNWEDQEGRVIMDKGGESLDAIAVVGGEGNVVAVGMGDGRIRFVRVGENRVLREVRHDEIEGVVGLGFEVGGRMVSGGGSTVKVWQGEFEGSDEEDEEAEEERNGVNGVKRSVEEDSDEDSEDDDESSEEEKVKRRKKKRKKTNGKAAAGPKHVMAFKGID